LNEAVRPEQAASVCRFGQNDKLMPLSHKHGWTKGLSEMSAPVLGFGSLGAITKLNEYFS
jgi:hypothetical protein